MSLFNDPGKTNKLDQIEDRALPASIPVVTPGVIAGALGFAAFAVSGSLATVGFVTLPPLTYGYQKIRKWMKDKRFEREHGCIAHLISSDKDMIQYIKIVGEKTVAAQLKLALEEGQTLSSVAKTVAGALLKPDQLPHTKVAGYLESTAPIDAEVIEKSKAISAQDEKQKTTTAGNTAIEKITKDVVQAFLDDLRCTILCAPPRTGKGIVAAGMMIGFKMQYPAGKLFSFTIKQFPAEDWYFAESDAHINPSVKDSIALAKEIYHLYSAWETSVSSVDAPSLFVFDELRDTLLALKGVKCEDVSPDIESMEPKFDDWLRMQLISAATLNQCHRRYLLLISPTSTAQGMTFKDANSLQSYSSFTLVTPSELAFSEGNNGTFAAPAIRPDSPLFTGWYGLAWHSKTKQWLGVPSLPKESIALRESQPAKLNYYKVQAFEEVLPDWMSDAFKGIDTYNGGFHGEIDPPKAVTATKAQNKVEVTEEELQDLVYTKLIDKLLTSNGEKTTLSKLRKNLSTKQQKAYTQLIEDLILEDERFDFSCREMPDGNKSISIWLKDDSSNNID